MNVLLDTNVLLRLDHVGNPHRTQAQEAIERLADEQHTLRTVPKCSTSIGRSPRVRPDANGLGFSVSEAQQMLADHKELFPPLRDERGILERWEDLVATHRVTGKTAHDARLAAALLRHGLNHLLTFNVSDFVRFSQVTAFTPADVVAGIVTL